MTVCTPIPKDTQNNDDTDNKRRRENFESTKLTIPAAAVFVKQRAAPLNPDSPVPAAGPSALHRSTTFGMASTAPLCPNLYAKDYHIVRLRFAELAILCISLHFFLLDSTASLSQISGVLSSDLCNVIDQALFS